MKIGSHVGLSSPDFFVGSVNEAKEYGANCFMVYTGAPQNTIRKSIEELKIKEANNDLEVVIHAPYIVNLANPDVEKRNFAISFLTNEVKRTVMFGSKIIVLHPGAHMKQGVEVGIELIADGVKKILDNTKDLDVIIALETMAGKGSEVGSTFEEIAMLINSINSNRVGVCFDTCHVNDAGYDLTQYDKVMDEFDRIVGIDKIKVFHINDSKNPLGSHKDRHENIGLGTIGFDNLMKVVNDPRFNNIPHILETPYVDDLAPYKEEIKMILTNRFNNNLIDDIKKGRA